MDNEFITKQLTDSQSSIGSTGIEKDQLSNNPFVEPKSKAAAEISAENNVSSTAHPVSSQLPPMQAVAYDPNRIPSSVFTSKSATPMEWSVASNESLFSIHMGNSSFSRDHIFLLYRSGEFPKLEESNGSPDGPIPVSQPEKIEKKSQDFKEKFFEPEMPVFKNRAVSVESEKMVSPEKTLLAPVDELRHSTSSTHSFQFPLLEGNYGGGSSAKSMPSPSPRIKQYPIPTQMQIQTLAGMPPPKARRGSSWFSCFSCCSSSSHGC